MATPAFDTLSHDMMEFRNVTKTIKHIHTTAIRKTRKEKYGAMYRTYTGLKEGISESPFAANVIIGRVGIVFDKVDLGFC